MLPVGGLACVVSWRGMKSGLFQQVLEVCNGLGLPILTYIAAKSFYYCPSPSREGSVSLTRVVLPP